MREFIRGWRRKVGCGLLVMAMAVMAAWLRSYVVYDWITFWLQESGQSALSQCGCVVWQNCCRPNPPKYFRGIEIGWESRDAGRSTLGIETHLDNYLILAPTDSTSEWSWSGFYFGAASDANGMQRTWIISHSLLLLPLTLLSAYLLLWNPLEASQTNGAGTSVSSSMDGDERRGSNPNGPGDMLGLVRFGSGACLIQES